MNNLTNSELKIMNNLTMVHDLDVRLGDKIQEVINNISPDWIENIIKEGTPENAKSAEAVLTISGVVIDGETVTVGNDVFEFAADEELTVSEGHIPIDIFADAVGSYNSLTMDTQPTSGDTVKIGDKTYIFVPVGTDTADGEVSIGVDKVEAQANLVAAINGTDGISFSHPLVSIGDFTADVATVTALVGGVSGDLIETTETFTALTNIFSNGTLDNGVDCTDEKAATAFANAITNLGTEGIIGTVGISCDTVEMIAPTGAAGNDIPVSTTMDNASFGVDVDFMSGGKDGTIASGIQFMIDDTNIYVSIGENTVTGTNWRKIALTSF